MACRIAVLCTVNTANIVYMSGVTHLEPGQDTEVLLHVSSQHLIYGDGAQGHPVLLRHSLQADAQLTIH